MHRINLGSDDYFTKPFSAMSLVMRVKAILRRIDYEKVSSDKHSINNLAYLDITLQVQNKLALIGGNAIDLTASPSG